MRAVGLHSDVVLITSRIWQTTCTLVRSGEEAFCIDSPVLPDELELVPAVARQAGFNVVGLLATHGDWDHLLGRYSFGDAALGCAQSTAERLQRNPGAVQRELRTFDEEHYVQRPSPLGLPSVQPLPMPGHCGIGEQELQLQPAEGHTGDGMAVWVPWADTLICGDYLSPVEIPSFGESGSPEEYLATLKRLEPLIAEAEWIVPGHGDALDAQRALAILREDRSYVEAVRERGGDAPIPLARRTAAQRRRHEANVALLGAKQ